MRISPNLALVASLQFGIGSRYDCHVYALHTSSGVILIDSGSGAATAALLRQVQLEFAGASIAGIILTHVHPDHACGAAEISLETGCPLYCPKESLQTVRLGDEEACGLISARRRGLYPESVRLAPWPAAEPYGDGDLIVAGQRFRAIHVRGHSADSYCLLTELDERTLLFSGDVLFYGAVFGVINQPDSGMSGYHADLPKLANLGVEALMPGHGIFTLSNGQSHINLALNLLTAGTIPRQIGQFDLIF